MSKMPTMFIPHGGGPCFFMDWNPPDAWDRQAAYLRDLPNSIGQKPEAILIISGHWEEDVATVLSSPMPDLLFDYYGFPEHTYTLKYPAPGHPVLAARVIELLKNSGIPVNTDINRGYDHGVFIPLKVAFPKANIPIAQLSLRNDLDPVAHIEMGVALQALRNEGVLIIGSGNTYHNMQVMMRNMNSGGGGPVSGLKFDAWLTDAVCHPDPNKRNALLSKWSTAPGALDAHPREEHLMPLHVVAGAAGTCVGKKTLEDHVLGAIESAFSFG